MRPNNLNKIFNDLQSKKATYDVAISFTNAGEIYIFKGRRSQQERLINEMVKKARSLEGNVESFDVVALNPQYRDCFYSHLPI